MKLHILAGLFLGSLFFVVGGDAQSPDKAEKPVWTLEFIKVKSENFVVVAQTPEIVGAPRRVVWQDRALA